MDARWNRPAGIIHGDAPEIAETQGKRSRLRDRRVVQVVAVLMKIFEEVVVIFPAEKLEEFGAGGGDIDAPLRLVIAQTFARQPVVSAKISIGRNRRAVGVEGEDIRGHGSRILVARVAVDAVEDGGKIVLPEQPLVCQENVDGGSSRRAHGKSVESCVVEGGDPLADGKKFHDFAEIARQRARPAKGVDAIGERSRDQLMETSHQLDAGVIGRQDERSHALRSNNSEHDPKQIFLLILKTVVRILPPLPSSRRDARISIIVPVKPMNDALSGIDSIASIAS